MIALILFIHNLLIQWFNPGCCIWTVFDDANQEGHESHGGRNHDRRSVRLASADSKTSCGE